MAERSTLALQRRPQSAQAAGEPRPHGPRLFQLQPVGGDDDAADLAAGLSARPPAISPRFLYDALGARLFDAICALPEYYPTRTERALLLAHAEEIAALAGTGRALVDLGAGSCEKAPLLFGALRPAQYVAVDLDVQQLAPTLGLIQARHPSLGVMGVGTDLARGVQLPPQVQARRLAFYPGSSIGNFDAGAARALLTGVRDAVGDDGWLLIGFDLAKPVRVLRPAYDDPLQVTAAFNRNVLNHVNRVLGSDFALDDWRHRVHCTTGRVEMHLEAVREVTVRWPGGERAFARGDTIHTENSFKYDVPGFTALLAEAGFEAVRCWSDPQQHFAILLARA